MQLTHRQVLDASVDDVWAHFMDLRRVGSCFPGATCPEVDGDDFVGEVRSRLGPFTMNFHGTGSMTERDAENRVARLTAQAKEKHGLGGVTIAITLRLDHAEPLTEGGPARTEADLVTELVFLGAPMDFSSSLAQHTSNPVVHRFLECMARPVTEVGDTDGNDDDESFDLVRTAAGAFNSFARSLRRRG